MEILIANWYAILAGALFVAWQIARLTPSEKDDKVVKVIIKIIIKILTLVPDKRKGGGNFKVEDILKSK